MLNVLRQGDISDSFMVLLRSPLCAEPDADSPGVLSEEPVQGGEKVVTRWDAVCDEFSDVFGKRPSVLEREVTHIIILQDPELPPSKPR